MAHIARNLPDFDQEIQSCHPFCRAQSCLPREVVQMCDQSFHNISQSGIRSLRIDDDSVFGDIVDVQILHRRNFDICRVHLEVVEAVLFQKTIRRDDEAEEKRPAGYV